MPRRFLGLTALAIVWFLASPARAQLGDDYDQNYHDGYDAGYNAARDSGDVFSFPTDILPEPDIGDADNPALRPPEWRNGYRDGYDEGEHFNMEVEDRGP